MLLAFWVPAREVRPSQRVDGVDGGMRGMVQSALE